MSNEEKCDALYGFTIESLTEMLDAGSHLTNFLGNLEKIKVSGDFFEF